MPQQHYCWGNASRSCPITELLKMYFLWDTTLMVVWITGLPGAGKTSIAKQLLEQIREKQVQVLMLDGDQLREALQNLTYDSESRKQLAFTYARLAKMFSEQGSIAICATVSMLDSVREWNAKSIDDYLEVYVKVDPEILMQRNQKKLYSRATAGELDNVHGFDLEIEEPKNPHVVLDNDGITSISALVDKILEKLPV